MTLIMLEYLRRTQNLRYDDLAKIGGVTKPAVFNVAKRQANPSLKLATKLANYFKVSIEELFSEYEPKEITINTSKNKTTDNEFGLLTAKEVAEKIFKKQLSYQQILILARKNQIPYLKIGRKYFFREKSIINFIMESMRIPEKIEEDKDEDDGCEKIKGIKRIN